MMNEQQKKESVTATPRPARAERDRLPVASESKPDAPEFVSEGVRQDVEQHGQAVDPLTGRVLVAEGDGVRYEAEPAR